ncbi:MAG TPA: hypothetical protein VGG03_00365 [Thermoanaerobaculia bacterium]
MPNRMGSARIGLDGKWSLRELYEYSHVFSQVYSIVFYLDSLRLGLIEPEKWEIDGEETLLGSFPWRGGYSAVNFYQRLEARVPKRQRPQVRQIEYHSPGFMELLLDVPSAIAISILVGAVMKNADRLVGFVRNVYQTLNDMKLMKIEAKRKELELSREQIEFVRFANQELDELLEISDETRLGDLAPNELAKLKIQLSLYRRVKRLAEYQEDGKVRLFEDITEFEAVDLDNKPSSE